jgi:predicted nucleotidyltransferase
MYLDNEKKHFLKNKIIEIMQQNEEIHKVVIFGSFNESSDPNDIDIAIFENTKIDYLTLALKYRKQLREISNEISIDVIPVRIDAPENSFISELNKGEVIYER